MSQVEFEEENQMAALDRGFDSQSDIKGGTIVKMIINSGLAKTESQANIVMIVMILLLIGVMVFFFTR